MASVHLVITGQKGSKFYVVGGPVQPDRACYILRDADAMLLQRLGEGEYCHVLAPHHTGKTSLMAHAAGELRASGIGVATVDLTQISNRDPAEDTARWYYSLAYRIYRELRIKTDMQTWWQERSNLTIMQRLREFFLEIVLVHTDTQVVVFIDRMEAAFGRAVARELLGAIRACYDGRATEPEYERLSFVLLGAATVTQLAPAGQDSPFDVSTPIVLPDFDTEEVRRLAAGLPCAPALAEPLAQRVYGWTNGHPYLSQKILRGLSRLKVDAIAPDEVDHVVRNLFLYRDATRAETHLSAIADEMLRESPGKIARLTLYGRIRKRGSVPADPSLEDHRELLRSGLVVEGEGGQLKVRNRVYEQSFTARWVNENLPFSLKGVFAAAAAILMIIAIPIWYTEYLPDPYVRQLTTPNQDYVTALEAYRRLHFLPGFRGMANQLFADFLARQSRRATRLPEVSRLNQQLSEIPGGDVLATQLLAEFWDRRVAANLRRGDRDPALLYAARAMLVETPLRRGLYAELAGQDYLHLRATLRPPIPLRGVQIDADTGRVTTLDQRHRVAVWQFRDTQVRRAQSLELLAEKLMPLQRRLVFDGVTGGRRLRLTLVTDHPRPADLVVELRAPSGQQAELSGGAAAPTGRDGEFVFDSARLPALRSLLDENVNGTWTAWFADQVQGVGGSLVSWRLAVDRNAAAVPAGVIAAPAPIPEPGVAREAVSVLGPGGRRALTWPQDPAARGDVLVWDIGGGEVLARVPRPSGFDTASFALGGAGVLLVAAREVEIWDAERGVLLQTLPIEPSLAPVLSPNGQFLVVDSILGEADNALAVWGLSSRREIGRLVTGEVAELVAIDATGRYLAVGDGDRLVRVWSIRDGQLLAEFAHGAMPVSIQFDAAGRWLATQDAAHTLRLWSLETGGEPALIRRGASPWSLAFAPQLLLLGSLDRGFEFLHLPDGLSAGQSFHHGAPVDSKAPPHFAGQALLAVDRNLALTYDGAEAVKLWRVPPALGAAPDSGRQRGGRIDAAAISPDGTQLAVATAAGDVRLLPVEGQALLLPETAPRGPGFFGHVGPVTAIAFDGAGISVASGSLDGGIRVWDPATGAPRDFIVTHRDGAVHDLLFAPGDAYLFSASRESVLVTDVRTGERVAETAISSQRPSLAIDGDGEAVYIAADRDGLTRWFWRTGTTEVLVDANAQVRRVAFDPASDRLVIATADRRLRLLNTLNMEPVGNRRRLAAAADELAFSADGKHLTVRAGLWLYQLDVSAGGLRYGMTRMLGQAPAAARMLADGSGAIVLNIAGRSRPLLSRVSLLELPVVDPTRLPPPLDDLQQRINLTLSDWGEPQALEPF